MSNNYLQGTFLSKIKEWFLVSPRYILFCQSEWSKSQQKIMENSFPINIPKLVIFFSLKFQDLYTKIKRKNLLILFPNLSEFIWLLKFKNTRLIWISWYSYFSYLKYYKYHYELKLHKLIHPEKFSYKIPKYNGTNNINNEQLISWLKNSLVYTLYYNL